MHAATDIPLCEPTEFTAGETVKWRREDLTTHYPADEWTLRYYIFGREGKYTIDATADGEEFSITLSAGDSAGYVPGDYSVVGRVTKTVGGEIYEAYSGKLTVHQDPANIGTEQFDDRTHARKCLDAIEAVLEGRAGRADKSYQIAGRPVEHFTLKELIDARDVWAARVASEEAAELVKQGKANGRMIGIRFNNPV